MYVEETVVTTAIRKKSDGGIVDDQRGCDSESGNSGSENSIYKRSKLRLSPLLSSESEEELQPEPIQKVNTQIEAALGVNPTIVPAQSVPLDAKLVSRWIAYLSSGLAKDQRNQLLEKCIVPDNIKCLSPPKINSEVKLLSSAEDFKRNSCMEHIQVCLGKVISALGADLNIVINQSTQDLNGCLGPIADASKLLNHTHYLVSPHRRHVLEPMLNLEMKKTVCDGKVDTELFLADLSGPCKAMQALKKASMDLRALSLNWKTQPPRCYVKFCLKISDLLLHLHLI
ncbi:unnamed protein product [Psylliodes chrysocephalus]|uniref:Uncharacterized protein n=1 Tax=Psylliodes chrysocephalus TaxID=3402493 RepID=A0A9P0D8A4_9CUCU|nr:unnamed protein product [Psylliodes chrysocephala]